ncbi:MAG TPA: TonB family protein [Candidatus Methylomirabilis sp.]|nr:TonB family protein [Candidatus Methylomirabilis sp.]
MREPFLRPFSGYDSSNDAWLNRIRENLAQLLMPAHFKPTSANGAPIHLVKFDKSRRPARAQGASLLTHAAVFAAILFIVAHSPRPQPRGPISKVIGGDTLLAPYLPNLFGPKPSNTGGRGGGNTTIPSTRGNPPPHSSIVLMKPSLPQNRESQAPVPPTLFDPNAAPILSTPKIGLPWIADDTRSPGTGKGHTIGSTDGEEMGDRGKGDFGNGELNGRYGPNFTMPACAYCPYPTYTDEARHGKVQGSVTLRVLVGADGRAQEIRIVQGIGFGLDERAVEAVREWKFVPARDAAKRAVPTWVTVEAVFRLF